MVGSILCPGPRAIDRELAADEFETGRMAVGIGGQRAFECSRDLVGLVDPFVK